MKCNYQNTNLYALIHKNECCGYWKKSFFVAKYQDGDKICFPDWSSWCKTDNAPYLTGSQEIKDSLIESEDDRYDKITGKYVVVNYQNSAPYTCFDNYNDAAEFAWIDYMGDYAYTLYTVEESMEYLNKNKRLRDLYMSYLEDLEEIDTPDTYYEYLYNNLPPNEKDHTLVYLVLYADYIEYMKYKTLCSIVGRIDEVI